SARNFGLGELGTALEDKDFINGFNPAAWNRISLTRVEFGSLFSGSFVSDQNSSNYYSGMDFNGFAMAIPISEKNGIGIVFGLQPFSKVNYQVNNITGGISADDFNTLYSGEGGISKLFFGSSYRLPFDLSIGAELDYYFGNLVYKSEITFPNSSNTSALFEKSYKTKGLGGTLGLITPDLNQFLKLGDVKSIKFGIAYSFTSKMNTDSAYFTTTSYTKDTTAQGLTNSEIPSRLNLGLVINVNKYSSINVDYLIQRWSKYSFGNVLGPNLQDVNKVSAGFEYRVNPDGISFTDLLIWRFGLSYEQTPFRINGNSISQFSASAGVSLPMGRENTIDLGIRYAMRGLKENGLVKENILGLNVSLSFGELWFLRQDR
ncbi:MAG: hypothetical protein Q8Q47_02005, partial [Ignavibacteriaceae bacterium]|nr:hypothetical protein [Ignavibacteriaceae bacterium]